MWPNQEDEKGQAHSMYGKSNGKVHPNASRGVQL